MDTNHDIEQLAINTIRVLAADAVQTANSGHPGMPMGAATIGHVLWSSIMNFDPLRTDWPNRDRFVLSAGHGCLLQYILLHLTGYDITLDDLKKFRQLDSKTPGHPEYGLTPGIEVTTGPLGQGFATGVGFAIGQKYLAARYNKPDFSLFDYKTYVVCSDGDIMEGISSEAASIAGHLRLGNLICIYDDNHISIEGDTALTFSEDVSRRFESYGWHVQTVADANDTASIVQAINSAVNETSKPSIIKVRTEIAFGSPNKVGKASSHGSPLGENEVRLVKKALGFNPDEYFMVSESVYDYYRSAARRGSKSAKKWDQLFAFYRKSFPELATEFERINRHELPRRWKDLLPKFHPKDGAIATRRASGRVLNAIAEILPELLGGSADLSPSTDTLLEKFTSFDADNYDGRNIHFGVREHSMGAILNGLALTNGIIAYGATFLIFSEYMRPPIRLAAIMQIRPILVFTHDSIGLGEDGATHQPIEQLVSLRSIPNMIVIRPADANETAHAWRVALEHRKSPVVIVLTRQSLPVIDQEKYAKAENLEKGAYILSDSEKSPQIILIGTGSEVQLLIAVQEMLKAQNIQARVVSMPSWELFESQSSEYKQKVLPRNLRKRLAVEAGSALGWHKYVTDEGAVVGMHDFGKSAPAEALFKTFGFTAENIVDKAKLLIAE